MLYTPNYNTGSSRFCGPCAIMAVTGEAGSDVRDAVRQARGDIRSDSGAHMPVMGMSNDDLLAAMYLLGWRVFQSYAHLDGQYMRFKDFLLEHGRRDGPFIVNVTGHYMAVSHGEVCDARATSGLPIEIDRYLNRGKRPYKHSRVQKFWSFIKREEATC
jgi:hypothetical protein